MHVGENAGILVLISCLGDHGPATMAGGRSKRVVPPRARLEQLRSEQCLPVQRKTGRWMVIARTRKSTRRTRRQMFSSTARKDHAVINQLHASL